MPSNFHILPSHLRNWRYRRSTISFNNSEKVVCKGYIITLRVILHIISVKVGTLQESVYKYFQKRIMPKVMIYLGIHQSTFAKLNWLSQRGKLICHDQEFLHIIRFFLFSFFKTSNILHYKRAILLLEFTPNRFPSRCKENNFKIFLKAMLIHQSSF